MAQAGLTPHEILVDATLNGARLLGREREQGSVTEGKLADLVLLDADPLADIQNTTRVHLVVKDGRVFDPRKVLAPSPADLAQIQLNAYNSRDVETFVSVYSENVEVYDLPGQLLLRGRDKLRQTYTELFRKAPRLHCKLVGRVTRGRFVIDHELVTGIPGKKRLEATAIYETAGGKIRRVWFVR